MSEQNTFSIKQLEENNIVYLRFELNLPPKENAEYAFYLFRNNAKVDVQWYNAFPYCKFRIDSQGHWVSPYHFQHEYYKKVGDMVNSYIQLQMEDQNT